MDKAKIDAKFSAGIQQVTEAYQSMRRIEPPQGFLNPPRVRQLEQENEALRKENQTLKALLANVKSAIGHSEERDAYSRTDPRYNVPDPIEDGIGWVNPSEWGERG